ncbi:MAG TPA: DoxX family protein [Bryobacteraceae bacterium]|nr:DoxX family protein [Bryobacteraceae bacterium]
MSKKRLWTGRVLTGLAALLIVFAAVPKLLMVAPMVEGFQRAGFPEHLVPTIGVIELVCALVYLIPRTRVLGAILMTGLMGGATATNVRIGDPSMIVTVVLGVLAWGGLFFSDERVRALLPLRSQPEKS